MSDDVRRFSDEEFSLVLRKALELQDGRALPSLPSEGLSLEDMKAVAREVGLDPALVDRAVSLLPDQELSLAQRLMGGATRYRLEHSASRVLSKEDLTRVLDIIRRETQHHGKVTSELDGVTWQKVGEASEFHVSLFPRDGGTEVRVSVNRETASLLTWFFSVAGGMMAAGITGGIVAPETVAVGLAIAGTGLAGGLTLARTLWTRSSKAVRAESDRLMAALVREIGPDAED